MLDVAGDVEFERGLAADRAAARAQPLERLALLLLGRTLELLIALVQLLLVALVQQLLVALLV